MGEPPLRTPQSEDRLDSWKEIASYLNRDVTTVQRWEKREGMPVHRHLHDTKGSVYASRAELDAWARGRNLRAAQQSGNNSSSDETAAQSPAPLSAPSRQNGHFGKAEEGPQTASAEKAGARLLPDTSQAANTPVDAGGGSTSGPAKLRWLLLAAYLILTVVIADLDPKSSPVRLANASRYRAANHRQFSRGSGRMGSRFS